MFQPSDFIKEINHNTKASLFKTAQPVALVLDLDLLRVISLSTDSAKSICESTRLSDFSKRHFRSEDWYKSELQVHDKIAIVSQARCQRQEENLYHGYDNTEIMCINWETQQLIWTIEPSTILRGLDRIFLYLNFGLLWISTSTKCGLVSLENGRLLKVMNYQNYKRAFDELISSEADTSPYAQTGISVWDIAAFKDTVLITHDIERFSPLIFDVVFLKWDFCDLCKY